MLRSHVIDIGGTFAGAAVATPTGFLFHAVHEDVEALDASHWASLEELRRAVRHLFHKRGASRPGPVFDPLQNAASSLLLAAGRGGGAWMG